MKMKDLNPRILVRYQDKKWAVLSFPLDRDKAILCQPGKEDETIEAPIGELEETKFESNDVRRVILVNWAGAKDALEEIGFPTLQDNPQCHGDWWFTQKDRDRLVQKLFESGLNVMLKHGSAGIEQIFADDRSFQQR